VFNGESAAAVGKLLAFDLLRFWYVLRAAGVAAVVAAVVSLEVVEVMGGGTLLVREAKGLVVVWISSILSIVQGSSGRT
jgi:hypothetical protein